MSCVNLTLQTMRNLFLLLLILFGGLFYASGQPKSPYSFSLNGKEITPSPNFRQELTNQKTKSGIAVSEEKRFIILQFEKIPTASDRENLRAKGVELLEYLQGYAYYAAVTSKFYSISGRSAKNVRAMMDILPEYKISQALQGSEIPDYASAGKGAVKVVISFFKGVSSELIRGNLAELHVTIEQLDEKFMAVYTSVKQDELTGIASLGWVKSIEMIPPPAELENHNARVLHNANLLNSSIRGLGYGLTGKGVKLGLWDADVESHPDFGSRLKVREYEMHNTDHGTHTAGTIGSAGLLNPRGKGMAPEINIVSWNFNQQSNGKLNYQERIQSILEDDIELTSNSFGYKVSTCPNPYAYNSVDGYEDYIAYAAPYFLFVYSAGNDQTVCPGGYRTTSKNLKNSLIVGAVDEVASMSTFSSFGPSKDGRLIPNICGDGVGILSTFFEKKYGYMSGTSMATPGVAGTMALLIQRYKDTHGNNRPSSALMRGIACNTAIDVGNLGPDYKFGYGVINGYRAAKVLENKSFIEASVSQDQVYTFNINVPAGAAALKVMLSWTDTSGVVGTSKALINDLDLKVEGGGSQYLPWKLDPNNPSALATRGVDDLNNLEQVTVDNPPAGTYVVTVKGSVIPDKVQDFAIVYDVVSPYIELTYPIGGEMFESQGEELISWNACGYTQSVTIEYSNDNGNTYHVIASKIPANQHSFVWSVPKEVTSKAKIRVSQGAHFAESKEPFNIMVSPKNITINQAECGQNSGTLTWDEIKDAKYEVLKLNGELFEKVAEVNTNSYTISGLESGKDTYFAVRATDMVSGAVSERSLAVAISPAASVLNAPFKEDFEKQKAPEFTLISANGESDVKFINNAKQYGIRLEGPQTKIAIPWNTAFTTPEACFDLNSSYVSTASLCNVNLTSLKDKKVLLKFDYRLKNSSGAKTSFFRLKVNGVTLSNIDNTSIYSTNTPSYSSVMYDLSSFAGKSNVNIVFEAVCKSAYVYAYDSNGNYVYSDDSKDGGDFVAIDNVEMVEPPLDVAMVGLEVSNGETSSEAIKVTLKNNYSEALTSIPVSYRIGTMEAVRENAQVSIAPYQTGSYTFTHTPDFSKEGIYKVVAVAELKNDINALNDSIATEVAVDKSYKMLNGTYAAEAVCGVTLTDAAGRYLNYPNSVTSIRVFKPAEVGKQLKVTFSEFGLEPGYDYLYIYDGPSTAYSLLGKFDGSALPPSFTSSASGGELTFKFTSDSEVNDKGFVASLECVEKPAVDLGLVSVSGLEPLNAIKSNAESLNFKLKNFGKNDVSTVKMYYQINNQAPVQESFTVNLASGAEFSSPFTTKLDLSAPGEYAIKVWLEADGDAVTTNNSTSITVKSLESKVDLGVASVGTVTPFREHPSPITFTVSNYGTLAVTSIDAAYLINGGNEIAQNFSVNLNPGASAKLSFTVGADLTTPNDYSVEVYTKNSTDAIASNNSATAFVTKVQAASQNVVGSCSNGQTLVTSSNVSTFNLTKNYSVEFWMKPEENPKYGTIFSKGLSIIHHSNYYPAAYNTNCLLFSIAGQLFMTPSNSLKNGVWTHVALTSSSDGTIHVYFNGIQQVLSNNAKAIQSSNTTSPVRICSNSNLTQPYYGKVDEVRIWNSELSQATIAANLVTSYPANTAGLLAYYKFNENGGGYVFDYSSLDNTAATSGASLGVGDGLFYQAPGKLLSDVKVIGEKTPTEYDEATNTFKAIMDNDPLTNIVTSFNAQMGSAVLVGNTPQISGVTSNNLSTNPTITYTVNGVGINSGISQSYTLNVKNDGRANTALDAYLFEASHNSSLTADVRLDKVGTTFSKKVPSLNAQMLKATYVAAEGATLYINDAPQSTPQPVATDYRQPLLVKVVAENGRDFANYLVNVDARSSDCSLLSFTIPGVQIGNTEIDAKNHTVKLWIKTVDDVMALTPSFATSAGSKVYVGSIEQLSGVSTNSFSYPLVYTVVAEDGSTTSTWTAEVVTDNIKPVISLIGDATIRMPYKGTFVDPGVKALDNVDGDITANVVVSGTLNPNALGTYKLTYTVTDASGNKSEPVVRTVIVEKAPVVISLSDLKHVFDGAQKKVIVATNPSGISYKVTYEGSIVAPFSVGTYRVHAIVDDPNYVGEADAMLEITLGENAGPEGSNTAFVYSHGAAIYLHIKSIKQGASVKIYSRSGALVYESTTIGVGSTVINAHLVDGVYIVNLTVDGVMYRKNVVVIN